MPFSLSSTENVRGTNETKGACRVTHLYDEV